MTNLTRFVLHDSRMTIGSGFSSNACKFTPKGGTVSISTKLILPTSSISYEQKNSPDESATLPNGNQHQLSATHLTLHDIQQGSVPLERIVVHVEVADTGCGIKACDLAQGRLFSERWVLLTAASILTDLHRCFQSNGGGKEARWERYRSWFGFGPANSQVIRGSPWREIQTGRGINVLGRIAIGSRRQSLEHSGETDSFAWRLGWIAIVA